MIGYNVLTCLRVLSCLHHVGTKYGRCNRKCRTGKNPTCALGYRPSTS